MKASYNESTRVSVAIYKPRIEIIQRVVFDYYGIPIKLQTSHTRKGTSIKARQYIQYLSRFYNKKCPLAVIGLITGNGKAYDHATVSHSCREVSDKLTAKNHHKELVYPEVLGEIIVLKERIERAFKELKEPQERCELCGHLL